MEYYLSVGEGGEANSTWTWKKYDSIYANFHNEQNWSVMMEVRVMATLERAIRQSSGELEILCFPRGGSYMGNSLSGTLRMCALHCVYPYCLVTKSCLPLCEPTDIFGTPCNPARLLCPWDFPGKNTGVGCCFLLWGIFPTQGLNLQSPGLAGRFFTTEPPGKPNTLP